MIKNLLCILFVVLCVSCKKEPVENSELETSRQFWLKYKAAVNNSYSYISYGGSVFGGYTETKITVQNGKVIKRTYLSGVYPPNSQTLTVKVTWTENTADLNSHNQGAPTLTLDEIYDQAKNDYLTVDRKSNTISFTTDGNGLIASCGYTPKGCQDDCFMGVHLKSIQQYYTVVLF